MTTSLPKLLITGGQGQLAQAISHHPNRHEVKLALENRSTLDITKLVSIENAIQQFKPDVIINTAAYTAVDKAENDAVSANAINECGSRNLAIACQTHRIPLIHLSTDYVFDGKASTPYSEEDRTNPINIYGVSKLKGENAIREHCDQHLILRVSGIFSEFGSNFAKTILRLAKEKEELHIVNDQFTCPTYAGDIADTLFRLSKSLHTWGTYHYCNTDIVSWYDFATLLLNQAKKTKELKVEKIHPIKSIDYNAAAKRPSYSVLQCKKIQIDYSTPLSSFRKGIAKVTE